MTANAGTTPPPPRTIALLTVGNSFADNAVKYLPQITASVPGCKLLLATANLGGCPLERHCKLAAQSDKDASFKPYGFRHPLTHRYSRVSLREALEAFDWNVVTMQQYSYYSFRRETFEPWFGRLYAYIRRYAPHARIYIHQTWAYRADAPLFHGGGLSQKTMYERLTQNYRFYAGKYHCPILPSGAAFQQCRKLQNPPFTFPDPEFNYENPPPGALPRQTGSLNVGYFWSDQNTLGLDTHHANDRGCYLAGCTWFETLFGIDARKIAFAPDTIEPGDAAFLRNIAHQTVIAFPQDAPSAGAGAASAP